MSAEEQSISLLKDSVLENEVKAELYDYYSEVYIRAGKLVVVHTPVIRKLKKNVSEKSIRNLVLKGTVSHIKQSSCVKIEKMLTGWIKALYYNYQENMKKFGTSGRLPVFVTLTLPSTQRHEDNVIKQQVLKPFIEELQERYGVKYYFWKAEIQECGNIHFHLIIDHYIHYKKLQFEWNAACERLGYITEFKRKHGHKDAPSTHVEKITSIRMAVSYVCKYITKDNVGRPLEGRKWMCSRELRTMSVKAYIQDYELQHYIEWLIESEKASVYNDKYFSVLRFTSAFDYKVDYIPLMVLEKGDCIANYERLYNGVNRIPEKQKKTQPSAASQPRQLTMFEDIGGMKVGTNHFD